MYVGAGNSQKERREMLFLDAVFPSSVFLCTKYRERTSSSPKAFSPGFLVSPYYILHVRFPYNK